VHEGKTQLDPELEETIREENSSASEIGESIQGVGQSAVNLRSQGSQGECFQQEEEGSISVFAPG